MVCNTVNFNLFMLNIMMVVSVTEIRGKVVRMNREGFCRYSTKKIYFKMKGVIQWVISSLMRGVA